MRIKHHVIAAMCGLSHAGLAWGGEDYRCTIERLEITFSSNESTLKGMRAAYVGRQFTVERRTGLMAGALKNSFVTTPQVVDPGSTENSYKVVTTLSLGQGAGFGSSVYTLIIGEYLDGKTKPFLFAENDTLYFGTCEHF